MRSAVRRFPVSLLAVAGAFHGLLVPGVAGDFEWKSWRGPDASGSTTVGDYPVRWTADSVTWKVALPGKGGSSPIVCRDTIVLTSPSEGKDAVLAFDLDGKPLWETRLGAENPPKHRTLGSSSNSSPVTDGDGLFVYFKSGHFAALEFDGSVRWQMNLTDEFGPENLFWDQGSSPVVTDRHVILTRLHEGQSWIAAFDKKTGEREWLTPRNYEAPRENDNGYTTPVVYERDGARRALVWASDVLTAYDAVSGKLTWWCGDFNPEGTGFWPAIASPVVVGDIAVVPVGRDDRPRQSGLQGIRLGGRGNVTGTHRVWKRDDVGVFVPSPAAYEGRVYLLRNKGGVACVDPADGRTLWEAELPRHRSAYYASPLIADGVLYAAREDGTVFTARISGGFELLAEIPMGERIVASPVPAGDRILIRGDEHLFCIVSKGG